MEYGDVIEKIERYLQKEEYAGAIVVDAQNFADLRTIVDRFRSRDNITLLKLDEPEFCAQDELPRFDKLLNRLDHENKNVLLLRATPFWMLEGEDATTQNLKELLAGAFMTRVVILTYQCAPYLEKLLKGDPRLKHRIALLPGDSQPRPRLFFTMPNATNNARKGIRQLAQAVEAEKNDELYVETNKGKEDFPEALYLINEMKRPYQVLCLKDPLTNDVEESYGSEDDWNAALTELQNPQTDSWEKLLKKRFGALERLNREIPTLQLRSQEEQRRLWFYFIAMKLFGAGDDEYLKKAAARSKNSAELVRNIYHAILETDPRSPQFERDYASRKALLEKLGSPAKELNEFCSFVLLKKTDAVSYLTDLSKEEKKLLLKLLDQYGDYFKERQEELMRVLKRVYPDLSRYLSPYPFKHDLLNDYFQPYKWQKVLNRAFPEFVPLVESQAKARDYNRLLPARTDAYYNLDDARAKIFVVDAMGVEFLALILAKCQDLGWTAKATICRCEIPSVTEKNKEFFDSLNTPENRVVHFKMLDTIKHNGDERYLDETDDPKLPLYLLAELDAVEDLLKRVEKTFQNERQYGKAILIADHGATRLLVAHETKRLFEMGKKGKHSGRSCPKSEGDVIPDVAVDAGDELVLANHDRFKGSRAAKVESHGGATLEEVAIPIIEILPTKPEINVKLFSADDSAPFKETPEIFVNFNKEATFRIYLSQKLDDVRVQIDGTFYDAAPCDENVYLVKFSDVKTMKKYAVDVYAGDLKLAEALSIVVNNKIVDEKDLFS